MSVKKKYWDLEVPKSSWILEGITAVMVRRYSHGMKQQRNKSVQVPFTRLLFSSLSLIACQPSTPFFEFNSESADKWWI